MTTNPLDTILNEESTPPKRSFFSLGNIVLLFGLLAAVGVVGMQLYNQNQTAPNSGPAPLFEVQTFDGSTFTLEEQRGNIVVLNFWASWCGPCRDEAPELQAVYERYRERGVEFIGVTYLDEDDDSQAFMAEYGITYPNGPDPRSIVANRYNVTGAPETFIVDQNGEIAASFLGPLTPYSAFQIADLTAVLDELLAEQETAS